MRWSCIATLLAFCLSGCFSRAPALGAAPLAAGTSVQSTGGVPEIQVEATPANRPPTSRPARTSPARFEEGSPSDGFFPRVPVEAVGFDADALAELIGGAEESRSAALLLVQDGRSVVERYPAGRGGDAPLELHSLTKAVVSLVVATLLGDHTLPSLDVRIGEYLPEWSSGDRGRVTLRHVLSRVLSAGLRDAEPGVGVA